MENKGKLILTEIFHRCKNMIFFSIDVQMLSNVLIHPVTFSPDPYSLSARMKHPPSFPTIPSATIILNKKVREGKKKQNTIVETDILANATINITRVVRQPTTTMLICYQ